MHIESKYYAQGIYNISNRYSMVLNVRRLLYFLFLMFDNDLMSKFFYDTTVSLKKKIYFFFKVYNDINFSLFGGGYYCLFGAIIGILFKNNKASYIKNIYNFYELLLLNNYGSINVEVKIAFDINYCEKLNIIHCLSDFLGDNIDVFFLVDKYLIGGFIANYNNYVIDLTMFGNIELLYKNIL